VTAAVSLICVAALVAWAAVYPQGPDIVLSRETLVTLAVACGLAGAALVVLFNKGDVVARLQKGTIVVALLTAALTTAFVPLNRFVPGWRLRLAHYPELGGHARDIERMPDAMDAVDSVISGHLLANQPELWRDYGRYVVACARKYAVPVEAIVAVMQRETTAFRRLPLYDSGLAAAAKADSLIAGRSGTVRWPLAKLTDRELILAYEAKRLDTMSRHLDAVMADVVWDAKSGRRKADISTAPADVWAPDWPARLTLAASELLAGLAIVIVLGLFRRKPRQTSDN
jgi:hypothetical protein